MFVYIEHVCFKQIMCGIGGMCSCVFGVFGMCVQVYVVFTWCVLICVVCTESLEALERHHTIGSLL